METAIINIDSRFRNKQLYPNAGKFSLRLGDKIKDVEYIKVSSIEFPNFYYTFDKNKDNLSFYYIFNSVTHTISVLPGNYNPSSLVDAINQQFDYINSGIYNNTVTTEIQIINNKVRFRSNMNFELNFNISSTKYKTLGMILGFESKSYNSIPSSMHYIDSRNDIIIDNDNYLFIKVNDYGIIYNSSSLPNINNDDYKVNINTYLAKIILTDKNNYVFDNNNFINKEYKFRQLINIDKLDIELLDPYFNTINMSNLDYSLTLEVGYKIINY
jgi:hypothetical protein